MTGWTGYEAMKFYVLTLFPEMIEQGMYTSIFGRAAEKGVLSLEAVNIRDYAQEARKGRVDDYPYGGGAGMVLQAEPVYRAWRAACERAGKRLRTIYLTPQGSVFRQRMAQEYALEEDLCLLCGHYEGIDERVLEEIETENVSIGDYVLTGGELPAMVLMDAIARMVPGVLTNAQSGEEESFMNGLLEHPHYSRPQVWRGREVPSVLISGDHAKVDQWRLEQSRKRTQQRRPDLLEARLPEAAGKQRGSESL